MIQKDLVFRKELLEAGKITPVIDRHTPSSRVPEALRDLGKGHAREKMVVLLQARILIGPPGKDDFFIDQE